MPISATPVANGAAALDALAGAVRAAKGSDPLAAVTVIVPTNTAGVMARRALGRRGGAAALDVLTLYRLAELLGSPSLLDEGRKPVSTPVVDLAVKQVLRTSPGRFRRVADHPSTVVALRDLYREVRMAGPAALAALGRSGRGREPARIVAEVERLLAPAWYDEGDLMSRAVARTRSGLPDRLSRVVVQLPERLRPLDLELLRALGAAASVELITGLTGDADADADVLATVRALTGNGLPPAPRGVAATGPIDVVSTTDADDEVRVAVRSILDAARAGTPFERMAVLWPVDRPYARLVQHHLTAAEIPWNGRPGTETGERVVPRLLAELLDIDRRGLRRAELMALLGDVPAHVPGGGRVPTARWEQIGRRAGIVRDEDWDVRLPAFIAETRSSSTVERAEELLAFVGDLRTSLGDRGAVRPWSAWVDWAYEHIERWIGARTLAGFGHAGGLVDEQEAYQRTQKVLDRLRHLDSIGPPVDRAEFRATFVAELDLTPARRGTVGDGVHVGALTGAGGLDVDLVIVLGAVEGLLPPLPTADPLLGDDDRAAAGLAGSAERAAVAHRRLLAAVTTTPAVVVTVPRGDLRTGAVYRPTRWLDAARVRGITERAIDSHVHGLASCEFPITPTEHRVRELWTRVRAGDDIRRHALFSADTALARAVRLRDARSGPEFTEYDGDLSRRPPAPIEGPIAPTRIEAWAACPHAYFVRYVLGVRPVDEPDDIVSVTPLDRGTALHEAVHRLHEAVLRGAVPPPGPSGWTDDHADLLARFGNEVADELEAAGRTGRRAFWAVERPAMLAELARWIVEDREQWAGRSLVLSEASFGRGDGAPPVEIVLADGRSVAFQGQLDRVDRLPDGTLVVIDHKTGSDASYRGFSDDDPTVGGTRFQLPVYAAATRALLGEPGAPVRAEYGFFAKGNFRRAGITIDERTWPRVDAELARVLDGIEGGVFPAIPDPPGYQYFVACEYCQPDHLGTGERWPEWDRKRHDPRLARWFTGERAS